MMRALAPSIATVRRRACLALAIWIVVFSTVALATAQSGTAAAPSNAAVFDQTIVRVNGDLILKSEILWNLALDKTVAPPEFWDPKIQELMLRTIIDQRLILQEAAKLPVTRVTDDEVQAAIVELKNVFDPRTSADDDPDRFERRAELVGLTGPRLDSLVRDRIRITKFIDFRFRSFVVVTEPEIERYFNAEIKPVQPDQSEAALRVVRDAKRAGIEAVLIEEKVNAAIDTFLEEARARANVVHLDQ